MLSGDCPSLRLQWESHTVTIRGQRSPGGRVGVGGDWRTKIDTLDNDACVMAIRHLDCDRNIIPHQHQSVAGRRRRRRRLAAISSPVRPRGTKSEWCESQCLVLSHPALRCWCWGWCWWCRWCRWRCGGSPSPRRDWSLWEAAVPL